MPDPQETCSRGWRTGSIWLWVGLVLLAALFVAACFVAFALVDRHVGLAGECKGNLKMIQLGLEAYASDNDDYLPTSLDVLVPRYLRGPEPRCPKSGHAYIYLLQGRHIRYGELLTGQPLLAERGFPHGGRGPDARKFFLTSGGAFVAPSMQELAGAADENAEALAELLGVGRHLEQSSTIDESRRRSRPRSSRKTR